MMISGLSVVMGAPSAAAVGDYFDAFHATAVHLWQTGIPTEISGWAAANHAGFRYVTWVDKDGKSSANGQVLGGAAPLAGRVGYQIGDEPDGQASLDAMLAGAAAVKAKDPDGLRIINLNNSDEADALRAQAIQAPDIDVLSVDHYTYNTNAHSAMMKTRTVALAAGKPYWRYARSFYYKAKGPSGTAEDLRWDALSGAVYGFTGHTWFVYSVEGGSADLAPLLFSKGGDFAASKTALYATAATLNQQLAQIGRTLVLLESTDVRYIAQIGLLRPQGLSDWAKGAGGDPYLSSISVGGGDLLVGTFKDDCGEIYVMLQNQAHPGASIPIGNANALSFTLSFDFGASTDATLDEGAIMALDITTGAATPRALASTGAATAKLDVSLPAGDVLFFKYKNGRPFVRQ
jgi:hypothetical protein